MFNDEPSFEEAIESGLLFSVAVYHNGTLGVIGVPRGGRSMREVLPDTLRRIADAIEDGSVALHERESE